MLDEDQNADQEVWGVCVPRGSSGRFKCPDELKGTTSSASRPARQLPRLPVRSQQMNPLFRSG